MIGPNGSGKTTLLNTLNGVHAPDAGSILLDGRSVAGLSPNKMARLGVMRTFQAARVFETLTVGENMLLPTMVAGEAAHEARQRAQRLLEGVGLAHAAARRANLLEHAEQRFLEIARTLALRPRFVMLDEPAGGLTIAEIEDLGRIIGIIRDAGIGVLLVEHHTDFVFRISDRVTTLDLGRVIAHGTPDVVRKDPEVVRVYLGG